ENAKLELSRRAADHGWSFSAIGVSVDWFASDGIDHLSKFGQFDEVIAGRGWHGTGADLYFREIHGIDATPQILVLVRNSTQDNEGGARPIQKQALAYRSAGLPQIRNWLKREFPLPQETFGGLARTMDDP
ncbi:MAG: hypothetical protein OXI05_12760, partial [Bacteroidota bacterium]|nr:hypothetical protein [Bacteroidota bacterium]